MDYGSTLDLKFARFFREACPKLGLKSSLWQDCYSLLLTYILVYLRGGLSTGTHETANATNTN